MNYLCKKFYELYSIGYVATETYIKIKAEAKCYQNYTDELYIIYSKENVLRSNTCSFSIDILKLIDYTVILYTDHSGNQHISSFYDNNQYK